MTDDRPTTEPRTQVHDLHDVIDGPDYTIIEDEAERLLERIRAEGRAEAAPRADWTGLPAEVLNAEVVWDRAAPEPEEDGDCECGLPMSAHAGGFALLHHDEVVQRLRAEGLGVERLRDILDEAEGDGIIGPDYTPQLLAEYIIESLSRPSDERVPESEKPR